MRSNVKGAICVVLCTAFSLMANDLRADDKLSSEIQALKASIRELSDLISKQQEKILTLEKTAGAREAASPQAIDARNGNVPISLPKGQFNPDIGVVADIGVSLTESREDHEGNDKVSLRELELIIGHDVDPYSRFDSTITLSDFENVSVEEAYISHWGLPLDLQGRLGRFRPKIGKSSALHRDQLDTFDQPFVIQEFFGHEGLFRSGLELAYDLPLSADYYVNGVVLGILEGGVGEGGNLFGETRRAPTYYARQRNFWEISEAENFELGANVLFGSSDSDSAIESKAYGLDLTYINYVTPRNRLKIQSEAFLQDRKHSFIDLHHEEHAIDHHEPEFEPEEQIDLTSDAFDLFDRSPLGAYALIDYRLSDRWGIGGRYDYVEPVNLEEAVQNASHGYSAYLTFYQSEFARLRFQYQYGDLVEGGDDNRLFLQATAAIGVHKHKLQ